eukprot:gene27971-33776_t
MSEEKNSGEDSESDFDDVDEEAISLTSNRPVGNRKHPSIYQYWYDLTTRYWIYLIPLVVLLKILAAAIFVLLLIHSTKDTPTTQSEDNSSFFRLPSISLREKIHFSTLKARENGVLSTRRISTSIVTKDRMKFVLCKPIPTATATATSAPSIVRSSSSVSSAASPKSSSDPLDILTMSPSLVVHDFSDRHSPIHAPYTLVLNKFNTIPDHALLVSNIFAHQLTPVSLVEVMIIYWCMRSTGGVAWYNSNALAGASQAHKHLQLVPLDEFWDMRKDDSEYPTLLHDIVLPRVEKGVWEPYSLHAYAAHQPVLIHSIPEFDFQHGVVVLDRSVAEDEDPLHQLRAYAEYIHHAYTALLEAVGIDEHMLTQCALRAQLDEKDSRCLTHGAYNLVLSTDFIFLVRRSADTYKQSSHLNSMAYLGLALAASPEQEDIYRSEGILPSLQAISAKKL